MSSRKNLGFFDSIFKPTIHIRLLKNSMVQISKTASNIHFNKAETDIELVFNNSNVL